MSEINQSTEEQLETLSQTSDASENENVIATASTSAPSDSPELEGPAKKARYQNRTAKLMNGISVLMLLFMLVFFGFQIYMVVVAGLQQGFMISLLYNVPSLLLFLLLFLGASGLFRFFAEVLELMDRKAS